MLHIYKAHDKGSINRYYCHYYFHYYPWAVRYYTETPKSHRNRQKYPYRLTLEMLVRREDKFSCLLSVNISGAKGLIARNLRDWILFTHSFWVHPNQNWILSWTSLLWLHVHKHTLAHTHRANSNTSNENPQTFHRVCTQPPPCTDINPTLSSANSNNLFEPCFRESGAVTSEGWCARVWFAANRKIYFFQFHFCHTRTVVFPTGDSFFFFCNNHRDDRSQAAIWAV